MIVDHFRSCLSKHDQPGFGASTRVTRFRLQVVPPRLELHEMTKKAYPNKNCSRRPTARLNHRQEIRAPDRKKDGFDNSAARPS
jgi:hypothetical protein